MKDHTQITKIKDEIRNNGWDAALLTSPISVAFSTGFVCDPHERFLGLLLDKDGAVALYVPSLEKDNAEAVLGANSGSQNPDIKVIPVADTDNPYQILQKTGGSSIKKLAVEKDYLRLSQAEQLHNSFSGLSLFNIGNMIAELRSRKTPDQISRIKIAVRLIEEVMAEGLKRVRVGMTEVDLVAELEYLMKKKGADYPAFGTTVLAGANSALPHGTPGMTKIKEGEFLLIDMGVFKDGFCSDITRTFVIGEPTAEMEKIYHTVLAAEEAAIAAVRTGGTLAELDRTARRIIEDAGYGPYFTHRVGHGLGLEVHEYPSIHGENMDKIVPGMTFTIEPGIYIPGVGGVRIEDDVLATDSGPDVLTSFPKTLMRL
ncbi:M24 family metallopeptidase [Aneurinibacillus terranovensis]|uniref:M24 family metallopeptidase n=1 Tax=Aneurinibacillus terranovensis TaxID=278991 RepID=UPI000424615B|nr:Xaa-Pro peptidase family protein [Aneurinibacillus terranovensis]